MVLCFKNTEKDRKRDKKPQKKKKKRKTQKKRQKPKCKTNGFLFQKEKKTNIKSKLGFFVQYA